MSTEGKKFLSVGMFIFLVYALMAIAFLGHHGDKWLKNHPENGFSMSVARISAELHLNVAYPKTDYVIEGISWHEKDDGPIAWISSPSSPDSSFTLRFNHLGMLKRDGYENSVKKRGNTASRLSKQYSESVRAALTELKTDDLFFSAHLV